MTALIETRAKLSGTRALIDHQRFVIENMKRAMFGPRSTPKTARLSGGFSGSER